MYNQGEIPTAAVIIVTYVLLPFLPVASEIPNKVVVVSPKCQRPRFSRVIFAVLLAAQSLTQIARSK